MNADVFFVLSLKLIILSFISFWTMILGYGHFEKLFRTVQLCCLWGTDAYLTKLFFSCRFPDEISKRTCSQARVEGDCTRTFVKGYYKMSAYFQRLTAIVDHKLIVIVLCYVAMQ